MRRNGVGRMLHRPCFTGGSKLCRSVWAPCGWAAVQGHEARAWMYGAMPAELKAQRKIKRAELWACYMVLREALPPILIHIDHLGIVLGLERGENWCCSAKRPHADVWRLIWAKLKDIGYPEAEVRVSHVKAHRTQQAKANMDIAHRQHTAGSKAADILAKQGAETRAAARSKC